MNFQAYLEDTFRIIKEEPLILILGGFIVHLLTVFSLGIMAGPFLGGYTLLIIHYLRDNRKPSFNDIFSGLERISSLLPYFFVVLLILFGFLLLVIPGVLFATWWLYVLPLMVDREMSFSDAMRESMNKVNEKGFIMHLIFLLLIGFIPMMLIDFLSLIIPFIGVLQILLPPFQASCLASLYIDQFCRDEETSGTAAPAAETIHPSLPQAEKPFAPAAGDETPAGDSAEEPEEESGSPDSNKTDDEIPGHSN